MGGLFREQKITRRIELAHSARTLPVMERSFGRERDAGMVADVDLVGCKSRGRVDGVVVGRRHVRQPHVKICLFSVANHGERLGQHMVDPLNADVGAGVVSASVDHADANAVIGDGRQPVAKLLPTVGEECHRAPPERDILGEQNVGGAGGILLNEYIPLWGCPVRLLRQWATVHLQAGVHRLRPHWHPQGQHQR